MATLVKAVVFLIVVSGLVAAIYFLWQRQPKTKAQEEGTNVQTVVKSEAEKPGNTNTFVTSPTKDEILGSTDVKIAGQTSTSGTALIYSNNFNTSVVITPDGNFAYDTLLKDGLNLVQVAILDPDLKETQSQTLTVYVSKDDAGKNLSFKAGTVKKIFEGTLTITTTSGETELTTNSSTKYTNTNPPTNTKSPAPKNQDNDVRVGDYIVAIGQNDQGSHRAEKIEIYRDNKPQLTKTYAAVKIASPAKSNIFSGNNLKDSKLLELMLDKNSQIFEGDKKVNASSIAKDKTAITFFTERDGDNVVSLLSLI